MSRFRTPKYAVGDIVIVTASGVQGEVVHVDIRGVERTEIYEVRCPGFTSSYTTPMLKMAPAQNPDWEREPDPEPEVYGVDWNF